jgi:hypothetical protein
MLFGAGVASIVRSTAPRSSRVLPLNRRDGSRGRELCFERSGAGVAGLLPERGSGGDAGDVDVLRRDALITERQYTQGAGGVCADAGELAALPRSPASRGR